MAKSIVYGQNERVWDWIVQRVPDLSAYSGAVTIGIEEDGELIAGTAYDVYDGASIQMHIAATPGRRWMTRDALFRAFAYPFLQLKVNRITGMVREDNPTAQKFDEHLGFVREGLLRRACKDGTNMILYGMLREECRFIGNNHVRT